MLEELKSQTSGFALDEESVNAKVSIKISINKIEERDETTAEEKEHQINKQNSQTTAQQLFEESSENLAIMSVNSLESSSGKEAFRLKLKIDCQRKHMF